MDVAEPTPLATFAAEVRAHWNRLGWSQVALGEKIGYPGSFVSDVERCERLTCVAGYPEYTVSPRTVAVPGTGSAASVPVPVTRLTASTWTTRGVKVRASASSREA